MRANSGIPALAHAESNSVGMIQRQQNKKCDEREASVGGSLEFQTWEQYHECALTNQRESTLGSYGMPAFGERGMRAHRVSVLNSVCGPHPAMEKDYDILDRASPRAALSSDRSF